MKKYVREIEEREITNNKGEGTIVDEARHRESEDIRGRMGCVQEDGRIREWRETGGKKEKGRVEG